MTTTEHVLAVLVAAENLSSSISSRKEQVAVFLSSCRTLAEQVTDQVDEQDNSKGNGLGSASRLDSLQSTCDSLKNLIDALVHKGFLWSTVNADKLNDHIQITRAKMQEAYESFQIDEVHFQSALEAAQTRDRISIEQKLRYLSQDDNRLLEAIQDPQGVPRRIEELEVIIGKYLEHAPNLENPSPEDNFLRRAEVVLRAQSVRSTDLKFPDYILSSLDIEHFPHQTIGSGSSGQVYLGIWKGSSVAIKRMHRSEANTLSTDMRRRIYHEISLWATLRHENVLPLYGACPDADLPFLVMKYCPAGDVGQFLRKNPEADRFRLSCDVAAGLAFLHSKSIVHADIKGMNVLISGEQRALLTDFGLSIIINDIRNLSTYSTEMQNKPRGTMAWMAPEVHRGSRPDMASDVYSLGMTMWEIYSGETPFSGAKLEVLSSVVARGLRPSRPAGLSDDDKVWKIIEGCWEDNAKSRPSSGQVVDLLCSSDAVPLSFTITDHEPKQNSWNSSLTANSWSGITASKSLPWQADDSSDRVEGTSLTESESASEPPDETWTKIMQTFPPQWEHVPWGSNMYVNSTTIPFVPPVKKYIYRVVKGKSDLGVRETYTPNADGSQTINFLEYNQGYGIIDSTFIKVFATDIESGREFLALEWNPRNKPIADVESQYAREVRGGGFSWKVITARDPNQSQITAVRFSRVPANQNYKFRVINGAKDLGVCTAGTPGADGSLTINLLQCYEGKSISTQFPVKVMVLDRDVGGKGTLVASRWPSDTARDTSIYDAEGSPVIAPAASSPLSGRLFGSIRKRSSRNDPSKIQGFWRRLKSYF